MCSSVSLLVLIESSYCFGLCQERRICRLRVLVGTCVNTAHSEQVGGLQFWGRGAPVCMRDIVNTNCQFAQYFASML